MSKKILILDDNLEILLLFRTLVGRMGYVVKTTADGYEALQWLEDEKFDLILTDLKMPGIDGWTFVQAVRDMGIKTKVIVITAFPTMTDATLVSRLSIYACLIKPVFLSKLEQTVLEAINGCSQPDMRQYRIA